MMHPKNKDMQKEIAKERIEILFGLADKAALEGNFDDASNYVKKARTIGMRCNARMPSKLKRKFCKFCNAYLLPGKTSKVRINSKSKRVVITCMKCGKEMYFPYRKEVKAKRRKNASHK